MITSSYECTITIIYCCCSILKELVNAGADVNIQDEFSSSQRAAKQKRVFASQVAELRDREFCSWINHYISYSGFTPLHYAIIADNESIIRYLLENGTNNNGLSSTCMCVIEYMIMIRC